MDIPLKPYDLEMRLSAKNCHALMKGLVACKGQMVDSFPFGYYKAADLTLLRILLPTGQKTRFQEVSGLKLDNPPKPSLN